jgi:hypothetical protein
LGQRRVDHVLRDNDTNSSFRRMMSLTNQIDCARFLQLERRERGRRTVYADRREADVVF